MSPTISVGNDDADNDRDSIYVISADTSLLARERPDGRSGRSCGRGLHYGSTPNPTNVAATAISAEHGPQLFGGDVDDADGIGNGDENEGDGDLEDGVRRTEALSHTWSRTGLLVAYLSIFLVAFTVSLESQVTYPLAAFAVSSFNHHSLLSTVYVIQGVVNAVIKPPMAKIANVFGRLEAFSVSILSCVVGYIQMAGSQNVETYASAQIFYSAGTTGLQILQQIFIADTSSMLDRALFSSLPDTPFLVTAWVGAAIASAILASIGWRWGYGIWAVILPLAFAPLATTLWMNNRKAARLGLVLSAATNKKRCRDSDSDSDSDSDWGLLSSLEAVRRLLLDLDLVGMFLLSAGLTLVLIPLTLVSKAPDGWHNPAVLAMIATGLAMVAIFPAWESCRSLAPHPLVPMRLLRSRMFCAGCGIGFFYFMVFYLSVQPYFYSYLLVALNLPITLAGPITQAFSFASTVAAVAASLGIRHRLLPRPKVFIVMGATLYLASIGTLLLTRSRTASVSVLFLAQSALGAGAGLLHVATQLTVQASCIGPGDRQRKRQAWHPQRQQRSLQQGQDVSCSSSSRSTAASDDSGCCAGHVSLKSRPARQVRAYEGGKRHVAVATAAFMTLVEVGGAVGAAISGVVWGHLVPQKLAAYLPPGSHGAQHAADIYASVVVACSYPWGGPEREAISRAYQETMVVLLGVALAGCVPLVLLAVFGVEDYQLDEDDDGDASGAARPGSTRPGAAEGAGRRGGG